LPEDAAALDRLFYTVAASYARRAVPADEKAGPEHLDEVFSFHFDLKTGAPRIATPGFVDALALLKRLQDCAPKKPSVAPEDAFRDDEAVLCLTEASRLVDFQKSAKVRDRVGVCPVPGAGHYYTPAGKRVDVEGGSNRVPYLGGAGWVAVVPK